MALASINNYSDADILFIYLITSTMLLYKSISLSLIMMLLLQLQIIPQREADPAEVGHFHNFNKKQPISSLISF